MGKHVATQTIGRNPVVYKRLGHEGPGDHPPLPCVTDRLDDPADRINVRADARIDRPDHRHAAFHRPEHVLHQVLRQLRAAVRRLRAEQRYLKPSVTDAAAALCGNSIGNIGPKNSCIHDTLWYGSGPLER